MVIGYAQKFKMSVPSDNPCSSEEDEHSDPIEVADSTPENASISRKRNWEKKSAD